MEIERILKFRKFFFTLVFKWFKIRAFLKECNELYIKVKDEIIDDPELEKKFSEVEQKAKELFK